MVLPQLTVFPAVGLLVIPRYICCQGECAGTPNSLKGEASPQGDAWLDYLVDVTHDPFDMNDVKANFPELVQSMRTKLPPACAAGCAHRR